MSLAKLHLDLKTGVADQECRTDLSLNFENDLGWAAVNSQLERRQIVKVLARLEKPLPVVTSKPLPAVTSSWG